MTIPICPTHGKPMRPSQTAGAFFCPAKMPDGTYCTFKVAAPSPTAVNGAAAPATGETLAAASLDFAAALFRGAGGELSNDALAVAIKAYAAMKAVL